MRIEINFSNLLILFVLIINSFQGYILVVFFSKDNPSNIYDKVPDIAYFKEIY